MFINMSFRDKLIIFIFSVLLLGAIFIFAILKPVTADTETLKTERDTKKATWTEYETKIARLEGLREDVQEKVDEAKSLSTEFTPEPANLADVDDMITAIIGKHNLKSNFSGTHPTATPLTYSYDEVTPAQDSYLLTTYDLKQAADLDGSVAKKMLEANQYSISVGALPATTVLATNINFECYGTRENLFAFVDELAEMGGATAKTKNGQLDGTIRITTIAIEDYNFGIEAEDPLDLGTSKCTFDIVVYHVEPPHFDATMLPTTD